jgi:vancomycin permeability regulator SanA
MDKIEQIARMCHQTNKAWCELNGDNSQKRLGRSTTMARDSAIKGVEFKLDNPDAGTTRTQCLDG